MCKGSFVQWYDCTPGGKMGLFVNSNRGVLSKHQESRAFIYEWFESFLQILLQELVLSGKHFWQWWYKTWCNSWLRVMEQGKQEGGTIYLVCCDPGGIYSLCAESVNPIQGLIHPRKHFWFSPSKTSTTEDLFSPYVQEGMDRRKEKELNMPSCFRKQDKQRSPTPIKSECPTPISEPELIQAPGVCWLIPW